MKVCVIGSGGREYSISNLLVKQNPNIELFVIPGNDAMDFAKINKDIKATDIDKIVEFCKKENIDYVVVTPDNPLVLGLVDKLEENGIKAFGPKKKAAMLEGSKSFAKAFMIKHGIPTAKYSEFDDYEKAIEYIKNQSYPLVIKADGLALGKGVVIVNDENEAVQVLKSFMKDLKFGQSSSKVVIEEFLSGPEISILSFCDNKSIIPMVPSMDHKKVFDYDKGPNTGGMGCIAPSPVFTEEIKKEFVDKIMLPTLKGLQEDNLDFRGCLYFGLMKTEKGLKVIEYNARFGDPETQVVLPLLNGNLLEIFISCTDKKLDKVKFSFDDRACACVVMACEGYPENPIKGNKINFRKQVQDKIVFAGVRKNSSGELESGSGRVLNVLGFGDNLREAINDAYNNLKSVSFEHSHYRTDIGKQALRIEGTNDL